MSGYEANTLFWAVSIGVLWPFVMRSFPYMELKVPGREASRKRQRIIGGMGVLNILLVSPAAVSAANNDHKEVLTIVIIVIVLQVVFLWWFARTRWVK